MDVKSKRNFVLVGHAHAGKTSLAESILFLSGATTRKGQVAQGNTVSDWNADEIERKTSINASSLICTWQNHQIQFVDTPGYNDFVAEVISSVRAVDSAVIVVDATSGVGAGTERAWDLCDEINLPRLFFVNKLDKENTDLGKIVSEIQETFSKKAVVLGSWTDQSFIETVAEFDDTLLEKYLNGQALTENELKMALRKAVVEAKIFPILGGSCFNDQGIKELLNAIVDFLPSPADKTKLIGIDTKTNQEKEIPLCENNGFSAFIFKTISDPYVGQLTLMRIFAGKLKSNDGFFNISKKLKERIGQLYLLQGKEQRPVEVASCGDIVAVAKLKDTTTLDTLGQENNPIEFKKFEFPEPLISASVKPKTRQDEEKISGALSKLTLEDPTFRVSRDPQTKELIISGLGDLHL
ncbi:MAG: GTP-binding protein, partial [Candidatus Cloacimonetes bacterium]|nr:GTP-binding protein [Candidatus Cloacimonadota bacterium]